jgi:hypothetical protein
MNDFLNNAKKEHVIPKGLQLKIKVNVRYDGNYLKKSNDELLFTVSGHICDRIGGERIYLKIHLVYKKKLDN